MVVPNFRHIVPLAVYLIILTVESTTTTFMIASLLQNICARLMVQYSPIV